MAINRDSSGQHSHHTVIGRGNPDAKVLLLGEKPGFEELKKGKVWVGKAGRELDGLLWRNGIDDGQIWFDNLLADAPTGEDWSVEPEDIERNRAHIEAVLGPPGRWQVIVALGAVATQYLLGKGIRSDIGTVHAIPHTMHGGRTEVFPTYHPAAGLHDADAWPYIAYDFQLLAAYLKGAWRPPSRTEQYPKPWYTPLNDRDLSLIRNHFDRYADSYIWVDTETLPSEHWMSFSLQEGEGFMIRSGYKEAIQAVVEEARNRDLTVVMQYAVHDIPVLRGMGWETAGSEYKQDRLLDTMVMAYLLQVEPQGLKNGAYRHCGMEMKDYLDLVGPHTAEKRVDWLMQVSEVVWGKPEAVVIEEKMGSKVVQPEGMNSRVKKQLAKALKEEEIEWLYTTGQGSLAHWWRELKRAYPTITGPVVEQVGELPHASLADVDFHTEAMPYSCRDADATGRWFWKLRDRIKSMELGETFLMDCRCLPMIEEMQTTGFKADATYFRRLVKEWRGEQGKLRKELAGMIGHWINPESSQQVEKVVYDLWKMPVFKETGEGRRSTSDKAIDWMRPMHAGIELIGRSREYDKGCSSFAEPIAEYAEADAESRIHTNLKYTRVVSGRFSATDPNLLAMPVRSALGKRIRDGFVAKDGCLLGSWDLNQIEMRFMAHESEDPDLIAAYWRGADIHKETAYLMFDVPVEEVENEQREVAKRVGFGVITGIQGSGLRDQFYLNGITKYDEGDCDAFIRAWFEARPRVEAYLQSCRDEARRTGRVRESVGGRIRYLQSIQSTNKRIAAEAERASHSHRISSGAQAYLKIAMAKLWPIIEELRSQDKVWIKWILQVHDELIFEFEEGYEEILNIVVVDTLCTAVKLRVPVKASGKWGKTWGKLK